jgi:hypothetical protein
LPKNSQHASTCLRRIKPSDLAGVTVQDPTTADKGSTHSLYDAFKAHALSAEEEGTLGILATSIVPLYDTKVASVIVTGAGGVPEINGV